MKHFRLALHLCCIVNIVAMLPSMLRSNIMSRVRQPAMRSRRLFSSASDDDSQYIKSYQLNGSGQGTRVQITTNTGHSLQTDIPLKMGGKDTAPQPVETLVAAWMGCTQATALFVGRHLPERATIDKLEFVNIEAFRDERGALTLPIEETPEVPSRLHRVTGSIHVFLKRNKSLSPEQLQLLKEQTEIRCPVANMIMASGCDIDVEWFDGSTMPV
jgi:uncharacterized OsmC-like protein